MVVGGGAAGVYGAIRAKTIAPDLNVVVIEKGKPLSKVCNVMLVVWSSLFDLSCGRELIFLDTFSFYFLNGFWRFARLRFLVVVDVM